MLWVPVFIVFLDYTIYDLHESKINGINLFKGYKQPSLFKTVQVCHYCYFMYNRIDTWRNQTLNKRRDKRLDDPVYIRAQVKDYHENYR